MLQNWYLWSDLWASKILLKKLTKIKCYKCFKSFPQYIIVLLQAKHRALIVDNRVSDSRVFDIGAAARTHSCLQSGSCPTDPNCADKRKTPSPSHFAFTYQKASECMLREVGDIILSFEKSAGIMNSFLCCCHFKTWSSWCMFCANVVWSCSLQFLLKLLILKTSVHNLSMAL